MQLNIGPSWSTSAAYLAGEITGLVANLLNMTIALTTRVSILRDPVNRNYRQAIQKILSSLPSLIPRLFKQFRLNFLWPTQNKLDQSLQRQLWRFGQHHRYADFTRTVLVRNRCAHRAKTPTGQTGQRLEILGHRSWPDWIGRCHRAVILALRCTTT